MCVSARGLGLVLVTAMLAAGSGCTAWRIGKHDLLPWHKDEPQVPSKVVAMWSNTVLAHSDRPSMRGFGARLMFYAGREDKPVMVEGSLVVYGFDETHRKKDDPRPDRKYIFTPEQFANHYSKSSLGHSYSVWVPWDDAMGSPCKVSLIVRFIPKQGAIVLGEQTSLMLPGPGQDEAGAKSDSADPGTTSHQTVPASATGFSSGVRQVSHEVEVPRPLSGVPFDRIGPQVRTTTIPVPLQSRLSRGASQGFSPSATASGVRQNPPPADAAAPEAQRTDARPAPASTVPRSGRFTLPRSRPLGDPIPLPRADHAGWPLPVAAARGNSAAAPTAQ